MLQGIWLVAFVLQWAVLLLLVILLAGVLRYLATFQEKIRLAAPTISIFEVGQRVSDFVLPDLRGASVASTNLIGRGQKTMLLLLSATCGSCLTLIDQVAELAQRTGGVKATGWQLVLIVVAEPGTADELVEHHQQLLSDGITILQETEGGVLQRYGVTGVPTGLALDAHGHLLDQTLNPHITWLYKTLRVSAPSEPITTGWQSKRGPIIEVPV